MRYRFYHMGIARSLLILSYTFSTSLIYSQIGGQSTYEFLNLPVSARETALGNDLIAIKDDDINLAYKNPAAITDSLNKEISFNNAIHFAGINFGYVGYGFSSEKAGNFTTGIQYISYGTFVGANPDGTKTGGNFTASELSTHLSWGKSYNEYLSYGVTGKIITSFLEQYFSLGAAVDIAGMYYDKEKEFVFTTVFKNIGTQLKPYYAGNRESLPFEIQMGVSKKLEHLPFRFSLTAHNLQRFDVRYDDPSSIKENLTFGIDTTNNEKEKKYIGDKILRHFTVGGELLLGKNMRLRLGYNHLRRREMIIANRRGLTGLSWGFEIRIKKFQIAYGSAGYHLAGGSNHLSISTNLNNFL